eukprot:g78319.t1
MQNLVSQDADIGSYNDCKGCRDPNTFTCQHTYVTWNTTTARCTCPTSNKAQQCGWLGLGSEAPSCSFSPYNKSGNDCPVSHMLSFYGDRADATVKGPLCSQPNLSFPYLLDNATMSRNPSIAFNTQPYRLQSQATAISNNTRFYVLIRPWPEQHMYYCLRQLMRFDPDYYQHDQNDLYWQMPRQHYIAMGIPSIKVNGSSDLYFLNWEPRTSSKAADELKFGRPFRAALGDRWEDWLQTLDSPWEADQLRFHDLPVANRSCRAPTKSEYSPGMVGPLLLLPRLCPCPPPGWTISRYDPRVHLSDAAQASATGAIACVPRAFWEIIVSVYCTDRFVFSILAITSRIKIPTSFANVSPWLPTSFTTVSPWTAKRTSVLLPAGCGQIAMRSSSEFRVSSHSECFLLGKFWEETLTDQQAVTPVTHPNFFVEESGHWVFYEMCTSNAVRYSCPICQDPSNAGICNTPSDVKNCPTLDSRLSQLNSMKPHVESLLKGSAPVLSQPAYLPKIPLPLGESITDTTQLQSGCRCEHGFKGRLCQVQAQPFYRQLEPLSTVRLNNSNSNRTTFGLAAPCAFPHNQAYLNDSSLESLVFESLGKSDKHQYLDLNFHGEPMVGLNCDIPTGHMLLVANMNMTEIPWRAATGREQDVILEQPLQFNLPGLLTQKLAHVLALDECHIQVSREVYPSSLLESQLTSPVCMFFGITIAARCEGHTAWVNVKSIFADLVKYINRKSAKEPFDVLSRLFSIVEYRHSAKAPAMLVATAQPETSGPINAPDLCIATACRGNAICSTETQTCKCPSGFSGLACDHQAPVFGAKDMEYFNMDDKSYIQSEAGPVRNGWIHFSHTNSDLKFKLSVTQQDLQGQIVGRHAQVHVMVSIHPWATNHTPEDYLVYSREELNLYNVTFNTTRAQEEELAGLGVFFQSKPLDTLDTMELELSFRESGLFKYKRKRKEPNAPLYFAILHTGRFTAHEMLMGRQQAAQNRNSKIDSEWLEVTNRVEHFGLFSGAYFNWQNLSKPAFQVTVTVILSDNVAPVIYFVAFFALFAVLSILCIGAVFGSRKYASFSKYLSETLKPFDLKRITLTHEKMEARKKLRMQANRKEIFRLEKLGFDPLHDGPRKEKTYCNVSTIGALFFVLAICIRYSLEMIKLIFNISILHSSLSEINKHVKDFTGLHLSELGDLAKAISTFFSNVVDEKYIERPIQAAMDFFAGINYLRAMDEGWNCKGAIAVSTPLFIPKDTTQFTCPKCKAVNAFMNCASCDKPFVIPPTGAQFACPH